MDLSPVFGHCLKLPRTPHSGRHPLPAIAASDRWPPLPVGCPAHQWRCRWTHYWPWTMMIVINLISWGKEADENLVAVRPGWALSLEPPRSWCCFAGSVSYTCQTFIMPFSTRVGVKKLTLSRGSKEWWWRWSRRRRWRRQWWECRAGSSWPLEVLAPWQVIKIHLCFKVSMQWLNNLFLRKKAKAQDCEKAKSHLAHRSTLSTLYFSRRLFNSALSSAKIPCTSSRFTFAQKFLQKSAQYIVIFTHCVLLSEHLEARACPAKVQTAVVLKNCS